MEHISTLIASFIGAAAGGAITALGFLFKRSEESRQKYRNLLFELFGLYRVFHATKELTPTKYVEALGSVRETRPSRASERSKASNILGAIGGATN